MKRFAIYLSLTILLFTACLRAAEDAPSGSKRLSQVRLVTESKYPSVRIKEYTLITDNLEAQRADAEAIMQVKMEIPRAMQTKDSAQFDRVLGRNFTFRAEDQFHDRTSYIRDRTSSKSRVKTADYQNLVLQFFGEMAVLTYRNVVEDEPGGPKAWKAEMIWSEIFAKEDGSWKVAALHQINLKMLNEPPQTSP
jgi:ketosteroid isomerase-like protein